MQEKQEEKLEAALLKVALGYQLAEVTEEYSDVNGELKLTKRRKTKKDIPPDLKAMQFLLSGEGGAEYASLSDEELEAEKERLLAALKAGEQKATKAVKKPAKKPAKKTTKRKTSVRKA